MCTTASGRFPPRMGSLKVRRFWRTPPAGKVCPAVNSSPPKECRYQPRPNFFPSALMRRIVGKTKVYETSKSFNVRQRLVHTIKTSCLPKLICELNASPHKETLSEAERSLLSLIRDTSISTTAEVTSRYHFAAHMGQLIAGVDGTGCHNFYPSCPFPGLQVMSMMKKVQIR
ncbi:unnamed protein product [Bemisia tabaci]|uniref:Uncharacterized protein n=1 Tax=Bemisia tabaci TaxID=7038 RepID=A0A9P0F389_BEMTA|nr:unnamed protein product [Bemisia tabaci]